MTTSIPDADQTASFAALCILLFVSQLMDNVDPTVTGNKKVEEMVMAGLNRILSMQTPAGGFAYWPGDTEPVAWGTAYDGPGPWRAKSMASPPEGGSRLTAANPLLTATPMAPAPIKVSDVDISPSDC